MKKTNDSHGVSLGRRIRELRMDRGLRQAELASKLSISPSYLNLIEHDRRRIGEELIASIASALEVEASALDAQVDQSLIDQLLANASTGLEEVELDKVAEFAVRYPGWSKLLAAQAERIVTLETRIQELTDRMAHDPALAASLHEVISTATAIRSTASILNSEEQLDRDWQQRFHKNIHSDAIRLAESSEALISYLEAPEEGEEGNSPLQEAEEFLNSYGFYFPEIEDGTKSALSYVQDLDISSSVSEMLLSYLSELQTDAEALPIPKLSKLASALNYDVPSLARDTDQPVARVLRRLASMPASIGHPPMGLITADAAGVLGLSKHLPGVVFPRSGACPLWPIYTSLGQPGRPVHALVSLPGVPETRIQCFAIAEQVGGGLGNAPQMQAMMLMIADPAPNDDAVQLIGPTCRICPRDACSARREPTVVR